MKKELKDYLHLYLGCELDVQDKVIGRKWKLTAVQSDCSLIYARDNYDSRSAHPFQMISVKPILRPLSDMTEDEKKEMGKLSTYPALSNYFGNVLADTWWICGERIKFMLSKHFDLFGLIESGLALYKTTTI